MPGGLNDILLQINGPIAQLLNGDARFSGFSLFTLAVMAVRNGKPATELYPMVYDKNGVGTYAGIEEKPVIIYHKCNSLATDIIRSNYGDGKQRKVNRYNMNMIVFHSRKAVGIEADELFFLIQSVFPLSVAVEPYLSVQNLIKNVILNTQQVFNSEYKGVTYFVKPEHSLMQIDYTIESVYNPDCFNVIY